MKMTNNMRDLTQDLRSSSEHRAEEISLIKDGVGTLREEAVEIVQDFHDARQKSGDQMRKELVQGAKLLAQNDKKRRQETRSSLKKFNSTRLETAAEMKKDLAYGQAKLKADVKKAMSDARTMIKEFQFSHQQMATELKNDLEKSRDARKAEVEGMRGDFRKVQKEISDDLKGASDAWKEMKKDGHQKAPTSKPGENISADLPPNLEEKLLTIINQHASGITLSEVAKELGIVTIVLGKAAKVLLEEGKIRKDEKTYFPGNN